MLKLGEILRYPLKSCKGESIQSALLTPKGIQWDRRWALFDSSGQVVTGRTKPHLLDLEVRINESSLNIVRKGVILRQFSIDVTNEKLIDAQVFSYEVKGHEVSAAANEFFSKYLNLDVKLLYSGNIRRPVLSKHGGEAGDIVSFADQAPLLLTTSASLADLNRRLKIPIGMDRFRPNVVIKGCKSYEEENWKMIKIGECEFRVIQVCERCVFTTINPKTKLRDTNKEPLKTLATYKKSENGGVYFGVHLVPSALGHIRVNDEVTIIA